MFGLCPEGLYEVLEIDDLEHRGRCPATKIEGRVGDEAFFLQRLMAEQDVLSGIIIAKSSHEHT